MAFGQPASLWGGNCVLEWNCPRPIKWEHPSGPPWHLCLCICLLQPRNNGIGWGEVPRLTLSGAMEIRRSGEERTQVSKELRLKVLTAAQTWVLGPWMQPSWVMFAWKNNLEVPPWSLFLFFPSSRRFVVSGKKRKEKLLGLECKTTGLLKKCLFFCKVCFSSDGSQDAL